MPADPGRKHNPADGLPGILDEWRRFAIHTALPGIIDTYDEETRRARVRIAIEALKSEGTCIERAPLLDVPVIFPAGAGGIILIELRRNDPVWVMFAERGIQDWKRSFSLSEPMPQHLFSTSDAVALAGFGGLNNITPAASRGISIQTLDGELSIRVDGDYITLDVPSGKQIRLGGSSDLLRLVTEAFITAFNSHTHSVSTGASRTGIPESQVGLDGTEVTQIARAK